MKRLPGSRHTTRRSLKINQWIHSHIARLRVALPSPSQTFRREQRVGRPIFPHRARAGYNSAMSSGNRNNTTVKALLIMTALIEAGAGLSLGVSPSLAVWLLFGTALDAPSALAVTRVAGAALLSLGAACWLARNDEQSRATTGLIAAMLLYNTAVVALLAYAGVGSGLFGVGMVPGIVLHVAMAAWCLTCLRMK